MSSTKIQYMTTTTTTTTPEDKILDLIKKEEKPTSEIARRIKRNYYDTLDFLENLEKEKKVEKIMKNKFSYWRTKHAKNSNK